jgi:hypothetical protein
MTAWHYLLTPRERSAYQDDAHACRRLTALFVAVDEERDELHRLVFRANWFRTERGNR